MHHPEMIMMLARQHDAERARRHARDRPWRPRVAGGDEPARRRRPRAGASRDPAGPADRPARAGAGGRAGRRAGAERVSVTRAGDRASPNRRGTRPGPSVPRRQLTDAREIRAVAHPLRMALLEALGREGPLTATEAGELLGESPANMSFHLRTLAKYGFVEEAPGGTGRQRPWRRVTAGHVFDLDSEEPRGGGRRPDPVPPLHRAGRSSGERSGRRPAHRSRRNGGTRRSPSTPSVYLTAEELEAVGHEFLAILDRYADRVPDRAKRPEGRVSGGHRRSRPPTAAQPVRKLTDRSVTAGYRAPPCRVEALPDRCSTQVLAAVRARTPVDERERMCIERFLVEIDGSTEPVLRARRSRARDRLGARRRPRGVVLHRHRILGIWIQPGGHIDPGETPWEAAVRETVEETGLAVAHPGGVPQLAHVDVHPGPRGHTHLDLRYLLDGGDADPKPPPGESQDVAWFSWDEALATAEPAWRASSRAAGRAFRLTSEARRGPAMDADHPARSAVSRSSSPGSRRCPPTGGTVRRRARSGTPASSSTTSSLRTGGPCRCWKGRRSPTSARVRRRSARPRPVAASARRAADEAVGGGRRGRSRPAAGSICPTATRTWSSTSINWRPITWSTPGTSPPPPVATPRSTPSWSPRWRVVRRAGGALSRGGADRAPRGRNVRRPAAPPCSPRPGGTRTGRPDP